MRSNFNTAPTTAPEISNNDWGFGEPISAGIPSAAGGYSEQDWSTPSPDTDWTSSSWSAPESPADLPGAPESTIGERLRHIKDKAVHGMGRKALDAVMNRLPNFRGQDTLQTAGREVAGAGVAAAKEAAMNFYGLEKDENEKLRVARKLKFGKAVVKTLVNPVGTASSVGIPVAQPKKLPVWKRLASLKARARILFR
jgi:hypothetical protein